MEPKYLTIAAGITGVGIAVAIPFIQYQQSLIGQKQMETILARAPEISGEHSKYAEFRRSDTYSAKNETKRFTLVRRHSPRDPSGLEDSCELQVYDRWWRGVAIDEGCDGIPEGVFSRSGLGQRSYTHRKHLNPEEIKEMEEIYVTFLDDFLAAEEVLP